MQLEEKDWETLLTRFKASNCTPSLGAAVNHGILPLGGEIANRWADDFDTLESRSDLSKWPDFLRLRRTPPGLKEMILELLDREENPFNFNDLDDPLNVLAKLPLPVYITTNCDDLLFRAIEHHRNAVGSQGGHRDLSMEQQDCFPAKPFQARVKV